MKKARTVGTMPMSSDILAPHMRRGQDVAPLPVGAEDVAVRQRGQQAVGADAGSRRIGADPRREYRDQADQDDDGETDDGHTVGRIGAPRLARRIAPRGLAGVRLRRCIGDECPGPFHRRTAPSHSFPPPRVEAGGGHVGSEIGEHEQRTDDENPAERHGNVRARTRRRR